MYDLFYFNVKVSWPCKTECRLLFERSLMQSRYQNIETVCGHNNADQYYVYSFLLQGNDPFFLRKELIKTIYNSCPYYQLWIHN